jgi:hypothetical protein
VKSKVTYSTDIASTLLGKTKSDGLILLALPVEPPDPELEPLVPEPELLEPEEDPEDPEDPTEEELLPPPPPPPQEVKTKNNVIKNKAPNVFINFSLN